MKLEAWGTKAVSLYLYTHESMTDPNQETTEGLESIYEKIVARKGQKERRKCVKLIHRCTYTASKRLRRIQLRERYRQTETERDRG